MCGCWWPSVTCFEASARLPHKLSGAPLAPKPALLQGPGLRKSQSLGPRRQQNPWRCPEILYLGWEIYRKWWFFLRFKMDHVPVNASFHPFRMDFTQFSGENLWGFRVSQDFSNASPSLSCSIEPSIPTEAKD